MLWFDSGVMFDFGFSRMFSAAVYEKYFCNKDIWIAETSVGTRLQLSVSIVRPFLRPIIDPN